MFTSQRKALFSMATGMELAPIQSDVFLKFANKSLGGRLEHTSFDYLVELVAGESKLLQQACYHFFYLNNEIDHDVVKNVVKKMIKQSDGEYRMIFESLTKSQKTALKAIALNDGNKLFYKETLSELNTTKQTLLASIKALIKTDMVYKESERYFIADRKLHLWCKLLYFNRL